jgi:hypothetical protein
MSAEQRRPFCSVVATLSGGMFLLKLVLAAVRLPYYIFYVFFCFHSRRHYFMTALFTSEFEINARAQNCKPV